MTIVMGLDQHKAQITAEWVDTDTGEIGRTRVAPARRATVQRFLARFGGRQLEVALEATTERRGRRKRAKTDRADAWLLQRMHAVLYHHGIPQHGLELLTAEGRA
jgi:transposase